MPKVSVIVPIYGVEKYIERCVRSLFEQTLDDMEFLFIDDCTRDRSVDILKSVFEDYPRRKDKIIIHHMEHNSGLASVRRWGVLNATGEYIIHCDSDDWVDVDMYRTMYDKAISENADIVVCDYYFSKGDQLIYQSQVFQYELMQGPLWNKLIKTSLYRDNEIFYPKANKGEDGVLMTQLSFYAKKCVHLSVPLYYYFFNTESICNTGTECAIISRYEQEVENAKLKFVFLEKKGVMEQYKDLVLILKSAARDNLLPLTKSKKYYKIWLHTFPEINYSLFFSKRLSIITKFHHLLKLLRLHS